MKEYKCVNGFYVPVVDEYFNETKKVYLVKEGSIWKQDDEDKPLEGQVKLSTTVRKKERWIEIAFDHLEESFEEVEQNA